MILSGLRTLLTIAFLMSSEAQASTPKSEWQEVSRSKEVTLYRKEVPGSEVLAYRAIARIDAPTAKILSIVRDTSKLPDWTYRVQHAEVIEEISPTERIEYLHASAPWPVKDRDTVFRSKVEYDKANQKITYHFESVDDPRRPPTSKRVRAQIFPSRFIFTPLEGGKATQIEAELHGDPKGSIPKWVVNMIQKRAPVKSLKNLKKRVASADIPDDPMTVEMLRR